MIITAYKYIISERLATHMHNILRVGTLLPPMQLITISVSVGCFAVSNYSLVDFKRITKDVTCQK